MTQNRIKRARTIREYRTTFREHGEIVVPIGSTVCNRTADGPNDAYRFGADFPADRSILAHDLTFYGLNIPAEFCEPYA